MDQTTSKPTWQCPAGCKITKKPCPHLEALLESPLAATKSRSFLWEDKTPQELEDKYPIEEHRIKMDLLKEGFTADEVEFILDRTLANFSYQDLAVKHNMVNRQAAFRYWKHLKGRLKCSIEYWQY